MRYIIGIDQSTQGTKALLFDGQGRFIARADLSHKQMINELGWVEHDPEEIYRNTLTAVAAVIEKAGADKNAVAAIGISNQRETALCWYRSGKPAYNAIVWQCARGEGICRRLADEIPELEELTVSRTGLKLSPYFTAAKLAWVLENVDGTREAAMKGELCCGTMDSYLLYRMTEGNKFKTDYSNASRTQIFNINTLAWDDELCKIFGIPKIALPQVCGSDSLFGETTLDGYFSKPVPIHAMLGDSHAALFGQGCTQPGMIKATYGTGSSIMMNIGKKPIFSKSGLVTSIAWGMNGAVDYVLEGNINYAGAVLTWLRDDVKLITSPQETNVCAELANPEDAACLVPAFTGLGAPYWDSSARASIVGMSRTTGKNELCRAALESIAYQINDVLACMHEDSGIDIRELRVDGGPTRSEYLMCFQSGISGVSIAIPDSEELSAIGAAYTAGIGAGLYDALTLKDKLQRRYFHPDMDDSTRQNKKNQWKNAVDSVIRRK